MAINHNFEIPEWKNTKKPPTPPNLRKVIEPPLGVMGAIWLSLIPISIVFIIGFNIGKGF